MNIEEKAKAYDEALEKAKAHINNKGVGDTVDLCRHLFSELRESEDERIRKEIINYLDFAESHNLLRAADYEKKKGWLAYLEKQKDAFENGRQFGIMQEQARQELEWPDKKQKDESLRDYIDNFPYSDQKEQKPIEWSYDNRIQYDSVESGIKAFASTYSFNIESKLFPQLTNEQQQLWRGEIEQAVIAGGEDGIELARDYRYKENRTIEWNQDDEQYLLICKNALQKYQQSNQWDANIISNWLEKRLKSSYQPKQEWSEEDDWKRKELIQYLEEKGDYRTVWMTWLKSLRPQSKEELAKMFQDEYNKGKKEGERIGHTRGYNKGYEDAKEECNKALSYHP